MPNGSTIARSVSRSGIGIHTGEAATVTLHPANAEQGIVFRAGKVVLPALCAFVVDTARCTVLGRDNVRVSTVEHLLSACAGFGVTDLTVEISGPELPIGDGSATIWTEALHEAGAVPAPFSGYPLSEPVIVTGKGGAFIAAYPSETLTLTVAASYDHPLIGTQIARFTPARENYVREIAPARTFALIEEVEALKAAGLAKGGSLDNAVIAYADRYSSPLRFDNELARHKLLDVLGDLLLASGQNLPTADIIAIKPGHRLNVALAEAISRLPASPKALQ